MGAKNLTELDPFSEPIANPEYFIPLNLQLDPAEKVQFLLFFHTNLKADIGKKSLYSPMANANSKFPRTMEQTNKFLSPLGLAVRNFTVFVGAGNSKGESVHIDGTKLADGTDVVLEGRLSYYEMAEAPGIIRWFPTCGDVVHTEEVDEEGKLFANHWLTPWVADLQAGKLTWATCPDYEFATSSNVKSALIRTNLPHHVFQGPGTRLTISAQLVWADTKSAVGVWDHIQQNYHLLGI